MNSIILHFENGRLGNQFFQYIGLKKYFPRHKIIFLGCYKLQKVFDSIDAKFISLDKIKSLNLYNFLKLFIFMLAKMCILGEIIEDQNSSSKIIIRKGILWKVYVTKNVYFQEDNTLDQPHGLFKLKQSLSNQARNWLKEKKIIVDINNLVFVHIRRGDYLHWPSKEFPAVLDVNWYKRAINIVSSKMNKPIFILVSDDKSYLKKFFRETDIIKISENNLELDLYIMSLCSAGILSASSFSYMGALLAKKDKRNEDNKYFLAPKYWAGHKVKKWLPKNFKIKWITYID